MGTSAILTMFVRELPTMRPGGTIDIYLNSKDEQGNQIDHTSPTVTIYDPNGNKVVDVQAGTLLSQGTSVYRYATTTTSTEGTYRAEGTVSVILNSQSRTESGETLFVLRVRKP